MNTIESQVQTQYNALATIYDQFWRGYIDATLSLLDAQLGSTEQLVLLDVACGTGALAYRLGPGAARQLVGIDLAADMLAIAAQKLAAWRACSLTHGRADALPYADASFDLVVTASALHYFPDPVAALREMARVVRPGGRVIVLDWCRDFVLCKLCDIALQRLDPAHHACYSQRELRDFLRKPGLYCAPSSAIVCVWFGAGWLRSASPSRWLPAHQRLVLPPAA
ncbi:methyltransferase domain-containing protein [Candidatus Gracilibacteria bacterium]|nr:methyltransferase domain-containing protein [Candidatus Gracilibacteria bacterium]